MPPVDKIDKPKNDPLIVLLDEIEILSAQTRLMELYLKRAHTAAFGEVEKIQGQFRAKVSDLKARLEDKEKRLSKRLSDSQSGVEGEKFMRRIAEQENLIQSHQEESAQQHAERASLQERLARLEAANRELENSAAARVAQAQQELESRIAQLQTELERKDQALRRSRSDASDLEQTTQAKICSLAEDLAQSRARAEQQKTEMERAESERRELRQRVTQLESVKEDVQAQAARDIETARQDAQAKIAALQSEVSRKTELLTRNQDVVARLEQDLKTNAETSESSWEARSRSLLDNHAAEIARRDSRISALAERVAELEGLAEQQRFAAADELSRAQKTFSADLAALRSELREKQDLLDHGRGALQNLEQELRNRNRELQGKLAAKESVVESQEDNLRHAQRELLIVRDQLAEKERMLAESQTLVSEQEKHFHALREDWQRQLAEKQSSIERYGAETDQAKAELAQVQQAFASENGQLRSAVERQTQMLEEKNALQENACELTAQIDSLKERLNETQSAFDRQSESLRQAEVQTATLCATLAGVRQALEEQQTNARRAEQDFATRLAEARAELEQKERALLERDGAVKEAEPAFRAQIEDLESRLNEKDRMLETRAREIGVLQARVESLSGQTARLEAAHKQAMLDAANETDRTRQALQNEIAAAQAGGEKQQALLEERQAAIGELEQKLSAEIDALKDQSAKQQTLVDEQAADLGRAEEEAQTLRNRIAQLESTNEPRHETNADGADAEAERISALEQQLQSAKQTLAEREAALQRMEQQFSGTSAEPAVASAQNRVALEDQSEQLRAAQDRIAELLDRLAQLEAARHTLQENAGHELQQLRDNFETRIAKLRMELAAKDQSPAKESPEEQTAVSRLEEGFQSQILELQGQLAEKHSLLENRNEELIKVKTEMDALQDRLAQLKTGQEQKVIDATYSVELREEDAVDIPQGFINPSPWRSTARPDPLALSEADGGANIGNGTVHSDAEDVQSSNRFTRLEGRVRSWNPELEKDSALGAGRRWNMGIFKRRWKS